MIPQVSQPCTTFCLDKGGQLVFGKNYGWTQNDGLVFVNKRGVLKTATLGPTKESISQPARWTSKYGSVTFNHLGRELPFGGVNEAGLVVEMMRLDEAKFPVPDVRPSIGQGQWIQYQLDNFSRIEQVLASDSQLRIKNRPSGNLGSHFLVCDKTGNCASVEFINGKLVYHTKETMPVKVLANSTYADSIAFLHDEQNGNLPIGQGGNISLFRFVRAAEMLKNYDPGSSKSVVDYAFDIIYNVRATGTFKVRGKPSYTQWSIVYDIKNLKVFFHTRGNEQIRYFALSSFDFSCKTPVKVLDIQADHSGDVTKKFIDYTQQINRKLIGNASLFGSLPENVLDEISQYPETTICTNK